MRDIFQLSWRRAPLALALGLILAGCSDSGGGNRLTPPATGDGDGDGIGVPVVPTPLPPIITDGVGIGADADPANLVQNGSFEAGVGAWVRQGDTVELSVSSDAFTGSSALLVEGRADTWQSVVGLLPQLIPGRNYTVSARIKLAPNSDVAEPPLAKFMLSRTAGGSGATTEFLQAATGPVTADDWTDISGTFTASSSGDGTGYVLFFDISDPEVSYIVDDILIKLAPNAGGGVTPNLAINSSFETDTSGWYASGSNPDGTGPNLTRTDELAFEGTHSARISNRTARWNAPNASMASVTAEGEYVISMAVRLPAGAANTQAQMTLQLPVPGAAAEYLPLATGTATADGWTVLRGKTNYAGGVENATVYLELPQSDTDYFVDALQITQLSGERSLIPSGNAEANINGWSRMGPETVTVTQSQDAAYRGQNGVFVSNRSANWHGASINLAGLPLGVDYDLSVFMRMAPGQPEVAGQLTVKVVQDNDQANAAYIPIQTAAAGSDDWVELSGALEAFTPTGTITEFIAYIEAADPSASFYVDEFRATTAGSTAPTFTFPSPVSSTTGGLAGGHTKYLGSALQSEIPDDFTQYWNQVTPENASKWSAVEEVRDVMDWEALDALYTFAKANQMPFKLHTLVWGSQFPDWIEELSADPANDAEVKEEVEEWIAALAARYPETDSIDVVNEALKAIAQPPFKRALGDAGTTGFDWVVWSFERARHYFPKAQLLINDYGIVNDGEERARYKTLVRILLARGLVDGVGLQGHYFNMDALTGDELQSALDDMGELGLPIYISELDLSGEPEENQPPVDEEVLQAQRYQELFPVLWTHPSVAGVTVWNYVWGETWRHAEEDGGVITALTDENGDPRDALIWLQDYFSQESAE